LKKGGGPSSAFSKKKKGVLLLSLFPKCLLEDPPDDGKRGVTEKKISAMGTKGNARCLTVPL